MSVAIRVLGAVCVVAATVGARVAIRSGLAANRSPAERMGAEMMARLEEVPKVGQRLERRNAEQKEEFVREMGIRGLPLLDDSTLVRVLAIRSSILHAVSVEHCTAMARGEFLSSRKGAAYEAMAAVDTNLVREWMDISYRAVVAAVRYDEAPSVVSERELARSFDFLFRQMGAGEAARLSNSLDDIRAEGTDACQTMRALYTKMQALPEPHRAVLARADVQYAAEAYEQAKAKTR